MKTHEIGKKIKNNKEIKYDKRTIYHISVDIFSDEYMDKINAIQLPNTKIKILQRLLCVIGRLVTI